MRHLPTTLATLALAISASTHMWARRELQRQQSAADFRWAHGRNDLTRRIDARKHAEDQHVIGVNGTKDHPAGGRR